MNTQYLRSSLADSGMASGTRRFARRPVAITVESREFLAGRQAVREGMALLSRLFLAWAGMGLLIGLLIAVSAV